MITELNVVQHNDVLFSKRRSETVLDENMQQREEILLRLVKAHRFVVIFNK